MSVCKETGSIHLLWPEGTKTIDDLPADLVHAVDHALLILNWHENCSKEEIPPKWMWHLDWELEDHWEQVDRDRKNKYGDNTDDDEDDLSDRDENEYASRFKS